MRKPAARRNDEFLCPLSSGTSAHIKGALTVNLSSNVRIEKEHVARVGSSGRCMDGSPNLAQMGSSSVFINGKSAFRQSDKMAHGGVVIGGSRSVFIG